MKNLLIVGFIVFIVGCRGNTSYGSAAEFEGAVRSWNLIGLSPNEARAVLSDKGFKCTISACERSAGDGVACAQRQRIILTFDSVGKINDAQVWKLADGQLATVCL